MSVPVCMYVCIIDKIFSKNRTPLSYHDISSKNPENIVEEKADEKNASNLVTSHRNLLDGLNTEGNAEDVVHHEVLRLHIHSGEDDRNYQTKNFLKNTQ